MVIVRVITKKTRRLTDNQSKKGNFSTFQTRAVQWVMYMQQLSQKILIQIGCIYMPSFTFWLESKNLNFKDSALTPKFHFD